MDKGQIIFIILMGWGVLIYGGLTFLVAKKKELSLINGFSNRSEEEQKYLIENGYVEALGKLLTYSFFLFLISYILGIFQVPYGLSVGLGLFLLVVLIGIVWINRYEVPAKRKKNYWITGSISLATLLFTGGVFGYGYVTTDITLDDQGIQIDGMYGEQLSWDEVHAAEVSDQPPTVTVKTNGFAMTNHLKGRFLVEEFDSTVTLFISGDQAPYIYLETEKGTIIFNRSSEHEAEAIYQAIMNHKDGET
ncbi:DUF3784 domain-containing protein [Gracilibacillus alcaliphilus]|uniref:DUF3784 domain-containing protein n=1 Tax=Gracilibacillus alcaliphilus TaxID=1401441 RepID=UPI001EF817CE|nr:DUF3784 domain-containing protein [Gracilibacillus alcaliphilus]